MCGDRNPMSLSRMRSQSHQSIPTHMLTIENNHRDSYAGTICLYCPNEVIGSEIHIILESFTASHLADGTLRHPKFSELAG